MQYDKIINLVENQQPISHINKKKHIQVNNDSSGTHNTNSQIKLKTTMLKSTLCDDSKTYIF